MQPSSPTKRPYAFTLVELLVVIAIMSLMLTFAANMLKGADKVKSLQSGMDLLTERIIEAREIAKGRATWTRVVIPVTPEDRSLTSRHLHCAAVLSWEPEDAMALDMKPMGHDNEWKMSSKITEFPAGVYLDVDLSPTQEDPEIRDSGKSISSKTFLAQISNKEATPCYYLEFDRQGRLTWPRGATKIVLISGAIRPDGKIEPEPKENGRPAQASGIMIFPNGQISSLRNKEQIFAPIR